MTALQTLLTWMDETEMRPIDLARGIGRSKSYVSQLLSGQQRPGLETAFKIEEFTRRRVKAKEWRENGA